MADPNVTEWVQAETQDGPVRIRADYGKLLVQDMDWVYLSPAQWEALKEKGDQLLAGARGRKALALASESMALFGLAADVEACLPEFPGLDGMTDEHWEHVARVLRQLPGSWPLL